MKKLFLIALVAMATVTTNAKIVSLEWSNPTSLNQILSKNVISVKMKSIYAEMLGPDAMYVTPDQSLYDILCESDEDVVMLLERCEDVFGVSLDPAENMNNVWTVGDVETLIFSKANGK